MEITFTKMEVFNHLPDKLLYKVMYMLNYEDLGYFCKSHIRARDLYQNCQFYSPGRGDNLINKDHLSECGKIGISIHVWPTGYQS